MFKVFSVLIASTVLSSIAMAQTSDTGSSTYTQRTYYFNDQAQRGWAGYVAANAGYTTYNKNLDVEGEPTSLKFLLSYVPVDGYAALDLGYGMQNQSFSQSGAADSSISGGTMELAARFQFPNR